MDIVNWDALQKNLLIKDAVQNPNDLVLVAANTTYNKRGDKYQTYAIPASSLVGGSGAIAIQYNGNPVSAVATVLNFVGGVDVSGDPLVTIDIPTGPVIFKNTDYGTDVTETLALSQTYSQEIPANTVKPGSIIRVTYRVVKDRFANNGPAKITISVGSSFVAAPVLAFAEISWSFADPNVYGQIKREFVVDSGNRIKFINNKVSIFSDDTEAASEEVGIIDWTVNQTFYFGIQHIDSAVDSAIGSFYCIEIY